MTRFAWAALGLAALAAGGMGQPDEPPSEYRFRSGASKARLLKEIGEGEESYVPAARGLKWLANQQKPGGSWAFPAPADPVAATGLALLPYLGAGQTHRSGGKYAKTIADGLTFLHDRHDATAVTFGPDVSPAGHALATAAVCEAAGMTGDGKSAPVARAALRRLLDLQRPDGGWAEEAGKESTAAGTVWAALALRAARMSRIDFPDEHAARLARYLDAQAPAVRGLTGRPVPTPAEVAALFGPDRPRTRDQVTADPTPPDPLWAFHATRARFAVGGTPWADWNEGPPADGRRSGGMGDWLTATQLTAGADAGSWAAPPDFRWGRLGATALHVLTLEVYYRDPRPR